MDVCREAVLLYGEESQIWMFVEEVGELLATINQRKNRGRVDRATIEAEFADVKIIMKQLEENVFDYDEIQRWMDIKLARLEKKILADRARGMQNHCLLEHKPVLEITHETP